MRRRILAATVSVAALAVVGFGVPLGFVVERFVEESATATVERAAVLASRQVSSDFATSDDPVELPEADDGIGYGLYDTTGTLVAGDGPDPADGAVTRALGNEVVDAEVAGRIVVAVPVTADERVVGVIRASRPSSVSDDRTAVIIALLAALGGGVVAASGGLGWVLAGRLSHPVGRLRDAARRLGDGDFAVEVPRSPIPELDEAALAINATARRLGDLVARERAFSADASHQLRTPLAGMRAAIETELAFPRDDRDEVLAELLSDLDRLERTVTELLAIARTDQAPMVVDLQAVLADVADTWTPRLRRHGRRLEVVPARFGPAGLGDPAMLRHALDVLVDNALRHGRGTVRVSAEPSSESIRIVVADEGPGFRPGVPEPPDEQSHGMGLPLARRLVEAMGGRLVLPVEQPGSEIQIVLRRAEPALA